MQRISLLGIGLGLSLVIGCGAKPAAQTENPTTGGGVSAAPPAPSALQRQLAGMSPARALVPSDSQNKLSTAIDGYFQRAASRRFYLHLDKPLYQPGEAIWFRVWELATPTLSSPGDGHGIMAQLVSPKGATVLEKRLQVTGGVATNDFELPPDVQGGEYIIRVQSDLGGSAERLAPHAPGSGQPHGLSFERKVYVSTYQPPQIKKKAEFLRKAYGPGDRVAAAVSLNRATGEPLAKKSITAVVTVDENEIARLPVTTDGAGNVVVSFDLPARIARGDGLLTLLVDDGGITESLQKRIPIVLQELQLDLYPEGGQLVTGLPGRVYFSAKNLLGKPADISGHVVDRTGTEVARFESLHNGLGRFELTPVAGNQYFVEVTKPVGITQKVPVPPAIDAGCTMQAVDDFAGEHDDVRVGLWCSQSRRVIVTGILREKRLGELAVEVGSEAPTVVAIPVPRGAQGAVRVTLFDDQLDPLAERLIYRGRGNDLKVAVSSDKKSYTPRGKVELDIATTDLAGQPVAADLSLAVVDDTVLSFADDKTANLLARLYLESEMPGQEIEEPNFYFSDDAKASPALDLVLGTQGWRRFEWQQVFAPPPPPATRTTAYDFEDDMIEGELMAPEEEPVALAARPARRPVAKKPAPAGRKVRLVEVKKAKIEIRGRGPMPRQQPAFDMRAKRDMADMPVAAGQAMMEKDEDWAGADEIQQNRWAWAPVRVFPAPNYEARYDGPRTDFRETVFWQPSVKTDASGKAKVSFYLSDAVTSFRATAEGVSRGGLPGRGETEIQSKLPVSLNVTMPLEVSRGDTIRLPVTLANETTQPYEVAIASQFGPAFRVTGGIPARLTLAGGQRRSFFASLEVVGDGKNADDGKVHIGIDTAHLKDEVDRTIKVVPLGFPQEISLAGTVDPGEPIRHEVDLGAALPGTIVASVTMYPSPLATMVQGTEAIVREPYGCFEQASSANYPNIMVLDYLEQNQAADPALVERTMGMLDRGYKKIAGYESPKRGYEWFGGDPGHEALTAYGLMEFADMTRVYSDVDRPMVARTQAWLKSRRDGKGGFQRNDRALDSFGRASPEVTNGYITYALSETGEKDLAKELAYQEKMAQTTEDPYLLALAANTMLNLEPKADATRSALTKLIGLQKDSGAFTGADHSITRSGGVALDIETTSLATLAFLKAGDTYQPQVRKAVDWLNQNRSGYGNFGSTQSTVLALKAMAAYAEASRATQSDGTATVMVNGKAAGQIAFAKGDKGALVFDDLAASLHPGKNTIEIRLDAESGLPYSLAIEYRSKLPASSAHAAATVATALSKSKVPMGESVRMKVTVKNITDDGIPMTLARVGLPGGLTFQTWQLEELKDKKLIDFYETREREVILYFRSMAPHKAVDLDLDLIARVPGEFVGPASRAYLYYTDEYKYWAEPVKVTVVE